MKLPSTYIDRYAFLAILLTIQIVSNAQISFELVTSPPPAPQINTQFEGVILPSIAFADIDGDNDQDVIITGENQVVNALTKVYINDGDGNFAEKANSGLEAVTRSSIAFADIDGDDDQDLLITGRTTDSNPISKLYANDGNGNFTEIATPFVGVQNSSIAFFDADGDNDQDVIITGEDDSEQPIAKLYTNNSNGNFAEVIDVTFEGVSLSSVAIADIDGDNDQDVLITGENESSDPSTMLYLNNGAADFTEVVDLPLVNVERGSVAFADIDGDNDQDLLITGQGANSFTDRLTKLYANDGSGNFTELENTPFEGATSSTVAFADIDGDNDQDVLITGFPPSPSPRFAKLYTNDGSGVFSELTSDSFEVTSTVSAAFADVDGDNDMDMLLAGGRFDGSQATILYINSNGLGDYVKVPATPFEGVYNSSVVFADVDGDNDQDALITGRRHEIAGSSMELSTAILYTNDGSGEFNEVLGTPFQIISQGEAIFADWDGDNDQDVLISGRDVSGPDIVELYTNNSNGVFTEVANNPFVGSGGVFSFGDIDGDDDLDVINGDDSEITLYTNDGTGNFSEVPASSTFDGFTSIECVLFSDIDGDDDLDLLISGFNSTMSSGVTKLYANDGNGVFSEIMDTPFQGIRGRSIKFADIDGDEDLDVLIADVVSLSNFSTRLFTNDGLGTFSEVLDTPFNEFRSTSMGFADVDGDGDQDVLISNLDVLFVPSTTLYSNDGNGIFTEETNVQFDGARAGDFAFGDVDGDNDQDVLIVGRNKTLVEFAKLYKNTSCFPIANSTEAVTACNSFTWIDGNTYTESTDSATFSIQNGAANGCDSIITLNLTILESATDTDTRTECNSFTWIDGNTYTDSNNSATFTIEGAAANGCDSIITLNLTILEPVTATDTHTECNSFTWIDGNTYSESNNSASFTIEGGAANGCDSIITLDLTILESVAAVDTRTECVSFTWVDGVTYSENNNSATFTFVGGAANGCDSIVSLDLTILEPATGTDTRTECDSFIWINGNTYTENNNSATFTIEGGAANGCDSIVTLDLTILEVSDLTLSIAGPIITANNQSATYQWLDCDNDFAIIPNETNVSFTALIDGNYAVELTENGCTDTTACEVIILTSSGLFDNTFGKEISIYPIPTDGSFSIDLQQNYNQVKVLISDLSGKRLHSFDFESQQLIELELDARPGTYILEIEADDRKTAMKLIKY